MVLAAQRSLFARSRGLPGSGVLSSKTEPFVPHGNVELILEASPGGAHYRGQTARRVLSPAKKLMSAETFRRALHQKQNRAAQILTLQPSTSSASAALRQHRQHQRFPLALIQESSKRLMKSKWNPKGVQGEGGWRFDL